jgi:hypothetical protein
MANKTKLFPNQSHYDCVGCGKTKQASEFYVNRKRSNGLQAYCKTCCKEKNSEFRIKRPNYYWSDGNELGYLQKNYDKFKEIMRKSLSADKTNKIYAIPTPDGTYIGATSRHLHARKANHKWSYFGFRNGRNVMKIPALFDTFDKYPLDMVEVMINSMYIVEEWEGDRKDLMKREGEIIRQWISEGKPVLNTMKIK